MVELRIYCTWQLSYTQLLDRLGSISCKYGYIEMVVIGPLYPQAYSYL